MPEAIQKLVSHAELAVKRCALLTLGFSTPGLVESLNDYFSGIVDRFGKILLQVRSETTVVSHANTAQSGTSTPNGSLYERQSSSVFGEDDYEIQRDELGRQEWSHFQMGLRVLSSTLALAGKVETEFEGLAIGLLRKVDGILQGTSNAKESEGDDAVCASSLLALRLSSLNSRELQGFIQKLVHGKTATDKDEPLFTPASLAISQLAIKAQRYLYDTLFLPIEKRLSVIPLMEVWTATGPQNPSPFDLELPQFSLSPGEYMTRIGEHLLSLPQQLDLYADDASLAYSTGSLPGMMDRGVSSELKEDGQTLHEEEDEEVDITYLWMTSVSIGTMSSFVSFASQIPTLSISGTSQLVADMRYLVNVLSAMEILPSKEFSMLMEGLSMDLETLQRLQERVRDMSLTTEIPDDLSGYASLVAEFPDLFSRIVSQRLGGGVNNTV